MKPRAAANPSHLAYYFCHDSGEPDVVCVFQLYTSGDAMKEFLAGDWYPDYLAEVTALTAGPPQITPAALIWSKVPSSPGTVTSGM